MAVSLGIKGVKHCQKTNNRKGFGVSIDLISTGICEAIQLGKSMQEIGRIFTNEQ